MAKAKKHGGARLRSGRKPVGDKVIALPVWVRGSVVDTIGKEKAQAEAKSHLEKIATKLQK